MTSSSSVWGRGVACGARCKEWGGVLRYGSERGRRGVRGRRARSGVAGAGREEWGQDARSGGPKSREEGSRAVGTCMNSKMCFLYPPSSR